MRNIAIKKLISNLPIFLAMILIIAGCSDKTTEPQGQTTDPILNGTWLDSSSSEGWSAEHELTMQNGSFEYSYNYQMPHYSYTGPWSKGSYTAKDGNRTTTVTQVHGGFLVAISPSYYGSVFTSKWYSFEEYRNNMKSLLVPSVYTEDEFNYHYRQTTEQTYIVDSSTLTINWDTGGSTTYIKK